MSGSTTFQHVSRPILVGRLLVIVAVLVVDEAVGFHELTSLAARGWLGDSPGRLAWYAAAAVLLLAVAALLSPVSTQPFCSGFAVLPIGSRAFSRGRDCRRCRERSLLRSLRQRSRIDRIPVCHRRGAGDGWRGLADRCTVALCGAAARTPRDRIPAASVMRRLAAGTQYGFRSFRAPVARHRSHAHPPRRLR